MVTTGKVDVLILNSVNDLDLATGLAPDNSYFCKSGIGNMYCTLKKIKYIDQRCSIWRRVIRIYITLESNAFHNKNVVISINSVAEKIVRHFALNYT